MMQTLFLSGDDIIAVLAALKALPSYKVKNMPSAFVLSVPDVISKLITQEPLNELDIRLIYFSLDCAYDALHGDFPIEPEAFKELRSNRLLIDSLHRRIHASKTD